MTLQSDTGQPNLAFLLPNSSKTDGQWHADAIEAETPKVKLVQSVATPHKVKALTGNDSEAAAAAAKTFKSANEGQTEAAPEADAAVMAAWLMQKPSLLEGILGHLESFAATAAEVTSTSCDADTSLVAVDLATQSDCRASPNSHSPHGQVSTSPVNQCSPVEAAEQPLPFGSGLLAEHDDCVHQKADSTSRPSHSTAHPQLNHDHRPQATAQDHYAVQADARHQQSDNADGQGTHSLPGSGPLEYQLVADASQLQCSDKQQHQAADAQAAASGHEQSVREDSPSGVSHPEPLMSRLLLEHCIAGRSGKLAFDGAIALSSLEDERAEKACQ